LGNVKQITAQWLGKGLLANLRFTSNTVTLNSTFVLSSQYLEETCNRARTKTSPSARKKLDCS